MKTSKILTIVAFSFALGFSMNNFAASKIPGGFNVAVVDIQKIVQNSPQINALKVEQKNKLTDLVAFIEGAKASLAKEPNEAKRKSLEEGYNKELNVKKAAIDKEYAQKLSQIDKDVTKTISDKAKADNYDLVLTKNVVLVGGTDITAEITKNLK